MKKTIFITVMVFCTFTGYPTSGRDSAGRPRNGRIPENTLLLPTFNGHNNATQAFRQYVAGELVYPPEITYPGINGTVKATFVVDRDGSLSDIEILSSPHPAMSLEVIRVLQRSPLWTPAYDNDLQPLRVRYNIPVKFKAPKIRDYTNP
ncbi:MAG: energy transducer TonB [Alistipes sp.]|nr:energy transducer TonB [Alistipes sp.]